jgi:type II secretory pathway component PulF
MSFLVNNLLIYDFKSFYPLSYQHSHQPFLSLRKSTMMSFGLMLYMVPQAASSWRRLQAKAHSVSIFLSLFSYFLMLLLLLLRKKLPILGAVLHTKRKKRRRRKWLTAADINGVLFLSPAA